MPANPEPASLQKAPVLQPSDLGLILSYQCQVACAHCLYNCSPAWQGWMEPDQVDQAFSVMRSSWQHQYQVHITGGEPFLKFPLLLYATQAAVRAGILCYLETNAGWCVEPGLVSRHFNDLSAAGLAAVLISCSPFHSAKIPLSRTLLGISKALEVFGPERVVVYLPNWLEQIGAYGFEEPVPLDSYIETLGEIGAGELLWKGYGLIPGGRSAYKLGYLASKQPAEFFHRTNCSAELLHAPHSHLDLYGNFIPGFCGGISLGDWHDLAALRATYEAEQFPRLVEILIDKGPYGLCWYAIQEYGYIPLRQGYVGKCHLCVDVRRHLVEVGTFPELQPLEFYRRF